MPNYAELHNQLNERIKALTTSDNAEAIAGLNELAGQMLKAHQDTEASEAEAKNALVKMVGRTAVVAPTQPANNPDPVHEPEPQDLETLIANAANEVIKNRVKK